MEGSFPQTHTATLTSVNPSAMLWEATFDAIEDEEASHTSSSSSSSNKTTTISDEEKEREDDDGVDTSQEHRVSVIRGSTLYVCVRDDAPAMPRTVFISRFDAATPEGGKGPIEASSVVELGDFLVKVDDVDVVGKGARHVSMLLQKGAGQGSSVVLTFRRLKDTSRFGEGVQQDETDGGGFQLSEKPRPLYQYAHVLHKHAPNLDRVIIFKHLLASEHIDKARFKSLAANGIPDVDLHLRPLVWRILLSYLPYDRSRWDAHLKEQRAAYQQFVQDLCIIVAPTSKTVTLSSSRSSSSSSSSSSSTSTSTNDGESDSNNGNAAADIPKRSTVLEPLAAEETNAFRTENVDVDTTLEHLREERQAPSPGRTGARASGSSSRNNDANDMSMSRSEYLLTRPRFSSDQPLFDAVRKDVVRTHSDQNFYLDRIHGPARYDALLRILFIYAKINVGTRYIQGMNELVGTLLYVLASDPDAEWAQHAEADTLFCFTHLMSQLRDVFIERMDATDTGIEGRIQQLETLLARHDPALDKHFRMLGLDAHFYSLRWITTLFCREFTLPDSIAVWDALFADDKLPEFVLFFCLAMLLEQREILLRNDFGFNLQSLQNYSPEVEVKRLLDRMKALRTYDAQLGLGLDDLESSNNRLRHFLARVKSHVREEMPVAMESFSTESKTQLNRAGAQLKNSFGSMRKLIVDNLSILPPPEGADTTTRLGDVGLAPRGKAAGSASSSVRDEP